MLEKYNEDAIAVIGMTGRFPGANNIDQFWDNLKKGIESVSIFSDEELDIEGLNPSQNKKYKNADAVLSDMDMFDASFFDLSPREAEIMDPQHRLFLEACWEAMELAGYTSDKYDGTISVYAGANLSSYMVRNLYSNPGLVEKVGTFKTMLTNGQDFLATRVSYLMNLKGPSVNVNTLCSSSLVAVHSACQSLIDYHCDVAIAGGVNVQVSQNEALFYQEGGIGASDGHCRAFDSRANGTVSGSGLGVVVLKRLEDAIEDGDNIEAVIRGTAINNDGANKNSYTAPNPDGQAECIADAIAMAEVDTNDISLIEAHGTGTNLGDPIEISGLTKAFGDTEKNQYCAIGSVKTNIGHLVTAGGVASLIKVILSMKNRQIPASLNFEKPNPKIDFEKTPFFVNTKLTDWEQLTDKSLIAGISSFGIGGTNAHVIVEESHKEEKSKESGQYKMLTLSAKTESALKTMIVNMVEYIDNNPDTNPLDLAYTMKVGRTDFQNKYVAIYKELSDLKSQLENDNILYLEKPQSKPVVFVFPDSAESSTIKGTELYKHELQFKKHFDKCSKVSNKNHNIDLTELLNTSKGDSNSIERNLLQFSINYSIASLLLDCGIKPHKYIVDECGVFTALVLDNKLSIEEAMNQISNGTTSTEHSDSNIELFSGSMFDDENMIYVVTSFCKEYEAASDKNSRILSLFKESDDSEQKQLLKLLGSYWQWNGKVNWSGYFGDRKLNRIPLPTYPFERKRYWIEPGNAFEAKTEVLKLSEIENTLDFDKISKAKISLTFDVDNVDMKNMKQNLDKILELKENLENSSSEYGKYKVSDIEIIKSDSKSGKKVSFYDRPDLSNEYCAPTNKTEEKLVTLFQDLVGVKPVGIKDNFFELGGHSLMAAQIITTVREEFDLDFPLDKLFDNPTVAFVSEYIDAIKVGQLVSSSGNREEGIL